MHISKTLFLVTLLSCTRSFSQVNLSSSLVACYALDGNANEPINNYAGTLSSVSPTTGHLGTPNTALYFSGQTSSYVELPNNSQLKPNQLSFSAWVNASNLNTNQMIVFTKNTYTSYHTAYALAIFDNGSGLRFVTSRQDGSGTDMVFSSTTVALNTWYHVAFSMDNTMTKIYVNGVLENSGVPTITNFNYDATRHVIFGGTNETLSTNETYNGIIDNARFYNRVLSAQEVSALYSQDPSCENTTGIAENKNENFNPYIYPNPARGNFTIGGTNGRTFSFTVTDLLGKEVLASGSQTGVDTYSTAELQNGIYFIKIKGEDKCSVIKLLKD